MNNTKVVNLSTVRAMLIEWDRVRAEIVAGRLDGLHTSLHYAAGGETIYIGGVYKNDPEAAMQAFLKGLIQLEGAPPTFKASQH